MAHLVYYLNLDRVYPSSELPKYTKIITEFQRKSPVKSAFFQKVLKSKTCDLENPVSESGDI